jgi:hypothetical protein
MYDILDVMPTVSDVELEAKIIQNINNNKDDEKIYRFFLDMYDVFFDKEQLKTSLSSQTQTQDPNEYQTPSFDPQPQTVAPEVIYSNADRTVALTNNLVFSKDNLNPLLNQTIKKIVSIDSQYRSLQYPYSTNFMFDLSEPLKDVVSLKLYSVQIPYTWYTINKDYGSNFIYLKGTSPGIDNGNFNYIIDISAGNYNATDLVKTVNTSLQQKKAANPDIDFGITDISYNTFTSTSTITVEISKYFTETSYYVSFPTFINPILNPSPEARSYTIPGYLGFDMSYIPINAIYSVNNVLPYKSLTATGDENNSIYTIDNSNNYFNIIQYTDLSSVIQTIPIGFTLANGSYSRNQLQNDMNNQLQTNAYLYASSMTRTDRTDAPFSYYAMNLTLNQKTTSNRTDAKLAVSFPQENASLFPVWTGTNSCFYFDPSFVEVSDLIGEAELLTSSFIIDNNPTIHLQCTQSGYISALNDYYINVQNAPNTFVGYTLTEYTKAINDAIKITDATTNYTDLGTSNFALVEAIPTFTFDINKTFTTKNYKVDFTDSVLNHFFQTTYNGADLSGNLPNSTSTTGFTFDSYLAPNSSYPISVDPDNPQFTIPKNVMTIFPQPIYGNANADPFEIVFVYTLSARTTLVNNILSYTDHTDLEADINTSISLFIDQNGETPLIGTNIVYGGIVNISGNSFYKETITINAFKNITQNGYTSIMYDLSGGTVPLFGVDNSWNKYLSFTNPNGEYVLADYTVVGQPISQYTGTLTVIGETLTLYDNSNNFFYVKPLPNADGLHTTTTANDIRIDLPATTYTTTIQLLDAMNLAFKNNAATQGTIVSIETIGQFQYIKLRMNVNKKYEAKDFSIVFYDTVSFVRCYVGESSVRNTTWDTTLGWILGFKQEQTYPLKNYINANTQVATITGDTSVNVNLYNYLLISLDDFNQNRLNDGVVTITNHQINLPLPSYASMSNFTCDICGNKISTGSTSVASNNLTTNQIYSLNQILNAQQNQPKKYTTGPFVKDVFAFIPLKVAGLQNGQTYVETSGQLQQQERLYFGPVNIHKMSITLYNDKGTIMDLNGTDFSFSFVCEQLYQKQKI